MASCSYTFSCLILVFAFCYLSSQAATTPNPTKGPTKTTPITPQPAKGPTKTTPITPQPAKGTTKTTPKTDKCHPSPDVHIPQYIVGYGSLMSTASKTRTYPNTGENLPVLVSGFSRIWNCQGTSTGLSTTYLGAIRNPEKSFNGIIFELPESTGIMDYDARESFYCRQSVNRSEITFLANRPIHPQAEFWIYLTKPEYSKLPTKEYPIVQSYVDTFLSGCFEVESTFKLEGFADSCMNATEEWAHPWVNDRIHPRRPHIFQPEARKIDKLIYKYEPKQFGKILIDNNNLVK